MVDQDLTTYFNKLYDETYSKAFGYVTKKCSNTEEIADILQEIYVEVYMVLNTKGIEYIRNSDAFVLKVAKTKVYNHYSLKDKLKNFLPAFFRKEEEGEEFDNHMILHQEFHEETLMNRDLLKQIALFISTKPLLTQKVFYLYYYCEWTIGQIANELSIGESNVKNKLYRTVNEVRELYGKEWETK